MAVLMEIRAAGLKDLSALTAIEAECFPPAEAASAKELMCRLVAYPSHFWLLEDGKKTVAFLDGMVTSEAVIRDEMYADATLHNEQGDWQTIFGVSTLPAYRRRGCAGRLIRQAIDSARSQGRKGCILTCKEGLLPYYEKFGFRSCGVSASVHGGAVWYDMRLTF